MINRIISVLVCAVFLLVTFSGCELVYAEPPAKAANYSSYRDIPGITQDEIDAVERLREHRSNFVYAMTPSAETFVGKDSEISGYSALFCEWLTHLFGIPFEPAFYAWGDLLDGLCTGEIDFTGEMTATEERMNPTDPNKKPYFMTTTAIADRTLKCFRLTNSPSLSLITDRPLRYAILMDTTTILEVEAVLPEGTYEIVPIDDSDEVYNMLKNKVIDAYINEGPAESIFDDYDDIYAEDFFPMIYSPVSLTTKNPELKAIISVVQKALDDGSKQYLAELYSRGYQDYLMNKLYLQLTAEEREYIEKNPVIPFAVEFDNYPVSFFSVYDKEWQGISIDAIHEIEKFTGLRFEIINEPTTEWSTLLDMLENGEAAIISELIRTENREGRFLWPDKVLMSDNPALISKSEFRNLNISEILYVKVGLSKNTAYAELFEKKFPNHTNKIYYDDTDLALEALIRGEVDMIMTSYNKLLKITNYGELVGYKANIVFSENFESTFGINKDEEVLCSIVGKALNLIDTERISSYWLSKTFDYYAKIVEARQPWLIGTAMLSLSVTALLIILFIIKRREKTKLSNLVHERTAKLEKAEDMLREALHCATVASQAKGDFLSHMSHEIRTPLNAVIGMLNIGMNTNDTERIKYCMSRADSASKHLLDIINAVLDISKIEAEKFELSYGRIDIKKMLMEISNVVNVRVEEKQQNLTIHLDEDVPLYIESDELHLSQVITNLLSNAIKFTPEKGMVRLNINKTKEIGDEVSLRIEVVDNGIGISKEQQGQLFTAFSQADSGIVKKYGGTGLGLAISKHIVELMDGEIWVESESGEGAKFIFTLKAKKLANESAEDMAQDINSENENARNHYDFSFNTILIAEDIDINREIISSILEDTDIDIEFAENGCLAVSMFEEDPEKYDLILMDINMPEMDGYEATRLIRGLDLHWAKEIPIIAMTANVFKEDVEKCLAAGMDDHTGKPIDVIDIFEKLDKYLAHSKEMKDLDELRQNIA